MPNPTFATISNDVLATISGGRSVNPTNKVMEVLDNPPRALGRVQDALGMGRGGSPGESYKPASMRPDGSIQQGQFGSSSGQQIPRSQ